MQILPSRECGVTTSRYLWELWLASEASTGDSLTKLEEYFGQSSNEWCPELWLYYWSIDFLLGHKSPAEIPVPAHQVIELYLRTPDIKAKIDRIIEWLSMK